MTNELLDLFDEAKRIIDKQEKLIKSQQTLILLIEESLKNIDIHKMLMSKQITDLQEELETITKDYIDVMGGAKKYNDI
jgi:hypothetical protein